ncbi:MAG: hypothetical protein ACKO01_03725 [Erythrobacter sp.]
MSEPGFASLGPSLLARKGGAKPAMRPQVAPLVAEETPVAEDQLEDLGWNDMGHDDDGAEVVPINGAVSPDLAAHGPVVRRQQRRLEERVLADAAMTGPEDREPEYDEDEDEEAYAPLAPEPVAAAVTSVRPAKKSRVPAVQSGRRAAFTLRLDADRHLKLRLAATMHGVSAQVLVTEALDRLLAEYDELDVIANHLKRH